MEKLFDLLLTTVDLNEDGPLSLSTFGILELLDRLDLTGVINHEKDIATVGIHHVLQEGKVRNLVDSNWQTVQKLMAEYVRAEIHSQRLKVLTSLTVPSATRPAFTTSHASISVDTTTRSVLSTDDTS